MTEFDIYRIEQDLLFFIQNKFSQEGVPPILRKFILSSIFNKFLLEAEQYKYSLEIEQKIAQQEEDKKLADFSIQENKADSNSHFYENVSNNEGQMQETPDGVIYN